MSLIACASAKASVTPACCRATSHSLTTVRGGRQCFGDIAPQFPTAAQFSAEHRGYPCAGPREALPAQTDRPVHGTSASGVVRAPWAPSTSTPCRQWSRTPGQPSRCRGRVDAIGLVFTAMLLRQCSRALEHRSTTIADGAMRRLRSLQSGQSHFDLGRVLPFSRSLLSSVENMLAERVPQTLVGEQRFL